MAKFYDYRPEEPIVATLSQQLSWSHFVELIKVDDGVKRAFYTDMCTQSHWSVRTMLWRTDRWPKPKACSACSPQPTAVQQNRMSRRP